MQNGSVFYDTMTTAPAGGILNAGNVGREERAALGERTALRSDLPPCTTGEGYARRADRESLPLVRVDQISDISTAGSTNIGFTVTHYARSTYTEGREVTGLAEGVDRTISRETDYTDIEISSKEALLCPNCRVGYIHPITLHCNGGSETATRCGGFFPEADEVVTRTDVADRYEPLINGFPVVDFHPTAGIVLRRTVRVVRRGGSDKAQKNPEKWQSYRRAVKGENPIWGADGVKGAQFLFGLIGLQTPEGATSYATVAFASHKAADAVKAGITIMGQGPNLFTREAAMGTKGGEE